MELLQKVTLYDLLGYTVPGSLLLLLWKQEDLNQLSEAGAIVIVLLGVMGFLTGIVISEIMFWIEKILGKLFAKAQWRNACGRFALREEQVRGALKNAGIIQEGTDEEKNYLQYYAAMYADIQADSRYLRIHNYASAALLYRNMLFVALFCIIVGKNKTLFEEIVAGSIGLFCFAVRWWRFNEKKIGYTVCWFMEKHDDKIVHIE